MNAASVDIVDMLEEDSDLGLVFKTNLFVGHTPDKPNNAVTIYDTPSYPPSLTFDKDERYSYASVQVNVRNVNYEAAFTLGNAIVDSLHGRAHETWNDTFYAVIYCQTEPALLEYDNKQRVSLIINFEIQRRKEI